MDKLHIINKALMKAGLPLAAAINDCDWNASIIYDNVAEELLRGFPWGFAMRFAVFPKSSESPAHGYANSYDMPADCMRVIDVHSQFDLRSPRARYNQVGRKVYANVSPCNARYVARLLDPNDWPPDFADAVACKIAVEIAALSAENMGLVPQLMQLFNISLSQAQLSDARESTERVPLDESLFEYRGNAKSR